MSTEHEREDLVFMARLAEQAMRYDEMVELMKKVAKLDLELTLEERDLLAMGYENGIAARLCSWSIVSSIEQKEEYKGNELNLTKGYRQKIEDELSRVYHEILSIIDNHLVPASKSPESAVYYYKMKGDYFGCLSVIKVDQEKQDAVDQSLKGYEAASNIVRSGLPPTHPTSLDLALKFSAFYYEILNSPERACHLAKQAVDKAIGDLGSLDEDCKFIMQLLMENHKLWSSDLPGGGEEGALETEEPKVVSEEEKIWIAKRILMLLLSSGLCRQMGGNLISVCIVNYLCNKQLLTYSTRGGECW